MVVGTGMEFFSYNVNPTYARERFHEAHELIVKAWTTDGPFAWEGKHFRFRYVNVWPRPFQKPHPPIWIPGSGSPETIEWVAEQHYTYMVLPTLAPYELRRQSGVFPRLLRPAGYTARHEQIGWGIGIYVRDRRAGGREYEPHFWYYARNLLKTPPLHLASRPYVPGTRCACGAAPAVPSGHLAPGTKSRGRLCGRWQSGDRAPAAGRLCSTRRLWGAGGEFFGRQCAHELTKKSMTLFAQEVMPKLRGVNVDAAGKSTVP